MSIQESLNDIKKKLAELKKKASYKKANEEREEAIALLSNLVKCAGQLEACKKDFNVTIKEQSKMIIAGEAENADTRIPEQMLFDAALGYMLVKDAIYALRAVASRDSIVFAYDMLDAAIAQVSGRGKRLMKLPQVRLAMKRDAYEHVTSKVAIDEKTDLLNSFFAQLKRTGDIETCLQNSRRSSDINVDRQRMGFGDMPTDSGNDDYAERLRNLPDESGYANISIADVENISSLKSNKN